jgi:hypothetical protein
MFMWFLSSPPLTSWTLPFTSPFDSLSATVPKHACGHMSSSDCSVHVRGKLQLNHIHNSDFTPHPHVDSGEKVQIGRLGSGGGASHLRIYAGLYSLFRVGASP